MPNGSSIFEALSPETAQKYQEPPNAFQAGGYQLGLVGAGHS